MFAATFFGSLLGSSARGWNDLELFLAEAVGHRRVIHIEHAAAELPARTGELVVS